MSECPWPLDTACFTAEWDDLLQETKDRSIEMATDTLRALTAYRMGGCPITVRPCKTNDCAIPAYAGFNASGGWFSPSITSQGLWINSCGCGGGCDCQSLCEIRLPAPVGRVDSIKINGLEMDLAEFRIDSGNILVYTGIQDCPFSAEQDLSLGDASLGTWSVTYLNSLSVSAAGKYAAAILAMEYAKACAGDKKCRLPSNVTSVVRTGVAMNLSTDPFPNGLTGIREVDSFIVSVNPRAKKAQPRIYSPDLRQPRIQGQQIQGQQITYDGGSP